MKKLKTVLLANYPIAMVYVYDFFFFPLKLFRLYTVAAGIHCARCKSGIELYYYNHNFSPGPFQTTVVPTLIIQFDGSTARATCRKMLSTPLTDYTSILKPPVVLPQYLQTIFLMECMVYFDVVANYGKKQKYHLKHFLYIYIYIYTNNSNHLSTSNTSNY
jgi:hypothetical protein